MLDAIIRFSLRHQLLILGLALATMGMGTWQASQSDIDVFPDLNRPRVVVLTEAPGLAPEEVETLITFPLETALNGASGVQTVRSSSGVGISVIYVEFEWGTDLYTDRQIVTERIDIAKESLPEGIQPTLGPVSSVMGQIIMMGVWSETGETTPIELRTLADWVIRQRVLSLPGVTQVFTMGGGRKQFQVLVDPQALLRLGVDLQQVHQALKDSNLNATGGYLEEQGPQEILVRALGRAQVIRDLQTVVVITRDGRPVSLNDVARVVEAPQIKRGDSSAFVRSKNGKFVGGPAVVLTVNKQPHADTRQVSDDIVRALADLRPSLPPDVRVEITYSQRAFIDRAIDNVVEALADGAVLVVIILFLFLFNFRTTFVTLTAIPLSLTTTALVFTFFDLSINTMTLGGVAVAMGELVDDAIVDVENIFRRLQENALRDPPIHPLRVVFDASAEIRNSIVFGTMIVVLVFVPLLALSGMEGRLFAPMGLAYMISLLASLVVSLTVTPVLSYLLMGRHDVWPWVAPLLALGMSAGVFYWIVPRIVGHDSNVPALLGTFVLAPLIWLFIRWMNRFNSTDGEGFFLESLKALAGGVIRVSTQWAAPILIIATLTVLASGWALSRMERDFLPPFNEGSVQLNVLLPPGTSLKTTNAVVRAVENRLEQIQAVRAFVRRTGRAELDEHAEGVNVSEIIIDLDPNVDQSREEVLVEIRQAMKEIPGIVTTVEQPLAHLISHLLSGVKAQIGIKLYGDDLEVLRAKAKEMTALMRQVPGVTDLMMEPQVEIPQLRISLDREQLLLYGLTPANVNAHIQTALNGEVVSQILVDQRTFDLVLRFDKPYREDLEQLRRLSLNLPGGGTAPLSAVAQIRRASGPNTINREKVRRRLVVQANVSGRGVVDVVQEIKTRFNDLSLPAGYFVEYDGQFQRQQSASRTLFWLFLLALVGVFIVLYTMFGSANFALQVMVALPMAFIGSVVALLATGQTLTVAAMVGFLSLSGIATRNGILLLNHYLYLVREEGESWTPSMLVRAGQERLAPVLMTALTSGIGLLPLALAAGEPGKEVLYPVATVIIGGLVSSTLLEFLVRPALFWAVGREAGARLTSQHHTDPLAD